MIRFDITPGSVDALASHIDHVKERLLVGIRLGMKDGLRGLSLAEVEAAAPHRKTGLLEEILGRATGRVVETDTEVTGTYRPRSRDKQPHYWLEFGAHVPAVKNKLMAMDIQGQLAYAMSHPAFEIPAHPFFFAAAEAYVGTFLERIDARVEEALNA
jgi:hypothetical protein